MDIRMPGSVNGIEATRLLVDRCADLAVIMFAAFPSRAIEAAARNAGAVEFPAKGATATEIIGTVRRIWTEAGTVPVVR